MPLIALALASASSLHAVVDPPANQQLHIENRVLLESNKPTSTMKSVFGNADGSVLIKVEIDTGGDEDFDVNALLSQLGDASGDVKIVIVGPDGKKQIIERELSGIDTLVNNIDVAALLDRIDLNAVMQQAHGPEHGTMEHAVVGQWSTRPPQHGEGRDMVFHSGDGDGAWIVVADIDADMGMLGVHEPNRHEPNVPSQVNDRWRQMAERVERNFNNMRSRHGNEQAHDDRNHDRRGEHGGPDEHPHHGHTSQGPRSHDRPDGERRDMDMHRMHMEMMDRDGHDMDPEIREHVMEMMRQGFHMPEDMSPLEAHRHNDRHGEGHGDMDMHRMHMEMMDRDDDPERFFRASESFIEQLQHAKAVAGQLDNDAAVALLAIWYASEHMEPEQCLDLMVSIMNDESVLPTVRRAAAFTGVQIAGEMGNDQLAGRILGAIVRGAGMTNEARRRHEHPTETDRVTDRAPQRERDRAPNKQTRDRS